MFADTALTTERDQRGGHPGPQGPDGAEQQQPARPISGPTSQPRAGLDSGVPPNGEVGATRMMSSAPASRRERLGQMSERRPNGPVLG